MKTDILENILLSDAEYWLLARRNWVTNGTGKTELPDQIIFAVIPHEKIKSREEIKLIDLEKLERTNLNCVHLNEKYAPFQYGITLYDVRKAIPVVNNIREAFEACLLVKTDDFDVYREIIYKYNEA